MKKVRFKRFDGNVVGLVILLCMLLLPGIIYWAVKRREFEFYVLTEDELIERMEKMHTLVDKGVIDPATYERKRDSLMKLGRRASKTADKRKPKPKVLSRFQNKVAALEYVVKSADKIDIVGRQSFDKAVRKL